MILSIYTVNQHFFFIKDWHIHTFYPFTATFNDEENKSVPVIIHF